MVVSFNYDGCLEKEHTNVHVIRIPKIIHDKN